MIADVDGDGKDDLIGIEDEGVYVLFSRGEENFGEKFLLIEYYTPTKGGFSDYNTYPRFFADINGDGKIFKLFSFLIINKT